MQETILITDLEQLLFNDFVKCAVDNDYQCLLKAGEASQEQLQQAWTLLYSDYCVLSGSKEALKTVKITAKIEVLNTKIFQVSGIIEGLRSIPAQMLELCNYRQLTALLEHWGYIKAFSLESLNNDLKRVEIDLSNDKLRLARLKNEKEQKDKRNVDTGPATKEYYVRAHHAIEAYKKILIPRAALTAYDFAIYLKELQDHNDLVTIQNHNNGRRKAR